MKERFSPIKTVFDLVTIVFFVELLFLLVIAGIWPPDFWYGPPNKIFDSVSGYSLYHGLFSLVWLTIRLTQTDAIDDFINKTFRKFPILRGTNPGLLLIILALIGLSIIAILRVLLSLIVEGGNK